MPKVATAKEVNVNISVTLPEDVHARYLLKSESMEAGEYLGKVAEYLMTQFGQGGLLIKALQIREIQALVGEIQTSDDIVSGVKKAMALSGSPRPESGNPYRATVELDPGLHKAAEENCNAMGYTIEKFLDEMINFALTSGMIYSWTASGLTMHFSDAERVALEKMCGQKVPKASDVLRLLVTTQKKAA